MIKTDSFTGEIYDPRTGWLNEEDYVVALFDEADTAWKLEHEEVNE